MNHQNPIRDRFKEYLDRKLGSNLAQSIIYSNTQKNNQQTNQNQYNSPNSSSWQSINSSTFSSNLSSYKNSSNKSKQYVKTQSMKKKLRKVKDIEQNVCSICLQHLTDRVEMSCKHCYCSPCLKQWLKNSSKCPYCRAECAYYIYNGKKYQIQQKQYTYQPPQQTQLQLDFECYMCEETKQGDEVLICDRCSMYACHMNCDRRLEGVVLQDQEPWYCHFCQ